MRIAAGVLLIVVSLSNLLGGLVYAGLGGLLGLGGDAVQEGGTLTITDESGNVQEQEITNEEAGQQMKDTGGKLAIWGFALLVLGALDIAAAVMLFTARNAVFIMVVAGLEILADGGSIVLTQTFIWSTVGIVGGILALVSAKALSAGPLGEPAAD